MGGDRTPGSGELPSATIEPPVSSADGVGGSDSASKGNPDNKDDTHFVNLLTSPHAVTR